MAQVTEALIETYQSSDGVELGGLVRSGAVSAAELVEAAVTVVGAMPEFG